MSAMTFSTGPDLGDANALVAKLRAKSLPLATVLVVHLVLFFLISSGMMSRMVDVIAPQPVMVTFVAPPPQPAAPVIPQTVKPVQPPPLVIPPPVVIPIQTETVRAVVSTTQPAAVVVEKTPAPAVVPVAAAPAPPAAGPKTITSGVEYIQPPQLQYPQMSRRMGEQGKVVLRVLINENGKPDQVIVQTSSGFARLDEAGRQAAMRALFKPHLEDGRAVAAYVIVPLSFQLAS